MNSGKSSNQNPVKNTMTRVGAPNPKLLNPNSYGSEFKKAAPAPLPSLGSKTPSSY